MTIMEFISKENIGKENPFEDCEIKTAITIGDYANMVKIAESIIFDAENGTYRMLFKEMGIRIGVIATILDLGMDEDYDIDKIFEAIICSDLYVVFCRVVSKTIPGISSVIKCVREYIDDKITSVRLNKRNTEEEVLNTLIKLLNNEAFQSILEQIAVGESEEAIETNG